MPQLAVNGVLVDDEQCELSTRIYKELVQLAKHYATDVKSSSAFGDACVNLLYSLARGDEDLMHQMVHNIAVAIKAQRLRRSVNN